MHFDKIDKQILAALFKNGRESLTSLEKIVEKADHEMMSHTGISKRISKLEDMGILKVQANLNLNKLDYKALFLLIEISNYDEINNIIKAYAECPRVFLLTQVTGQYNIIMAVIGQNIDVLHRYINHCGPTNRKGILHSAVIHISDLIIPKFMPIDLFSEVSKEYKCGNECKNCEAFLDGKCEGCGNF